MNDVIRRLQDAAHAVGETVDAVPPFGPEATPARRRTRVGTGRGRTWLMPVAAAAAVTLAVAGGAAVARHGGGAVDTAAGPAAGPAVAPSFLAQIRGPGDITIRSVADGHITDVVPRPAEDGPFAAVQAARDNRIFYAATGGDGCRSRLYQFTLDGEGRVASRAELPFAPPERARVTALAVSGNGATLAYGLSSCEPGRGASLVVTDTATGGSRTWTSTRPEVVRDLSLTDDGRRVLLSRATGVITGVSKAPSPGAAPARPAEPASAPAAVRAPDGAPREYPRTGPSGTRGTPSETTPAAPAAAPAPAEAGAPAEPETGAPVTAAPVSPGTDGSSTPPRSLPAEWGCTVRPASSGRQSPDPSGGTVTWSCSGPRDPLLLDTGLAGTLDDARVIRLVPTAGTFPALVAGVAITPDGSRVIAAQGTYGLTTTKEAARNGGFDGVVAYDLQGRQVEVLYRGEGGKAPVRWIDVDGTGDNVLVSRAGELGRITRSGYRILFADDAGGPPTAVW